MTMADGHGRDARWEASPSIPKLLVQVGASLHASLIVDREGRILRMDHLLSSLASGGDGVAFEGQAFEEVLHRLPWLTQALRTALAGRETVCEGGAPERRLRALVLPVFEDGGLCLGACARLSACEPGSTRSARHEALEQELTRTQRRYEELLDTLDAIVWEADVDFRFSFVNRQAERLLGFPSLQWVQEPDFWGAHVHPEDRAWARAYCMKATRERRPYEFEYRMVAANGRIVWLRAFVTVLCEEGQPLKLRGILVDVTEQREARDKLEQTVSLLRATFDSITDGVLVASSDRRLIAFNKRFQRMWGLSDELLRWDPDNSRSLAFAVAQVKEPERFLARIREMYEAPEKEGVDILELRDGRMLERTTLPQRLGSTIIGRIWSYRDITAERQAREKLEQTVSLLRATFDSIMDGVIVVDTNQRITAFNKRFQQLWGLPDDVLLENLDVMQAVLAASPLVKDSEEFVTRLQEMFLVSDQEYVDTIELRDGRILERTSLPQRRGDTIIGRIWSYRDVTQERLARAEQERAFAAARNAREQLEESFALLDTFLNNVPIGLGFFGLDLRFIRLNDALAALHGKSRHEEVGRSLHEMTPRVAATVEPLLRQVLDTGEPLIGLDMALEVPPTPGLLRHWRVSYYPVRTTSGKLVGVGSVVVELTAERHAQAERERLLREAHEAIQSRDDFLSIASHELKTPLTPLKLHLRMLEKQCASGQPLPPHLTRKALAQVDRLSGVISDMLDSSRIEAGLLELEREPLSLRELVREVLSDFRPRCLGHPLEYEECAQGLVVQGDRGRLAQMLTNLLENARKYSPLKGPIRVTLARSGAQALVSVSDSGIGIPEDQQPHLFARFFRGRNAPISGFGGLGLGLYICRHIVERHGGRIWVESETGHGSTFRFTLPVED